MSASGDIDNFVVELDTKLRRFKMEYGVELLERTRQRTPVRTGALLGGWGFELKQTSIWVYNTQPYAGYVEYGTPTMAPRAMLRTSLAESEQIALVAKEKAGIK
jgi:hypothetical protein